MRWFFAAGGLLVAFVIVTVGAVALRPWERPPKPHSVLTDTPAESAKYALDQPTFAAALAYARPKVVDYEYGLGQALLTGWAAVHLRWADIEVDAPETSFPLVKKDPDAEQMSIRRVSSVARAAGRLSILDILASATSTHAYVDSAATSTSILDICLAAPATLGAELPSRVAQREAGKPAATTDGAVRSFFGQRGDFLGRRVFLGKAPVHCLACGAVWVDGKPQKEGRAAERVAKEGA